LPPNRGDILTMAVVYCTSCVNDGSDILFGFLGPKRYSGKRVKMPKIF